MELQTVKNLPEIYAPLDPKVAPLVEALRRDGFRTTHSCDGEKEGAAITVPWVTIEPYRYLSQTGRELRQALIEWLEHRRIDALVCRVHGTIQGEHVSFMRIEVYSDLTEAVL